jgi:hypothetical protein
MGLRARLAAGFNCAGLATAPGRTVCTAMKKYGVILADVGSNWYLTGEASAGWEAWMTAAERDGFFADMRGIKGKFMEVVVPPGARVFFQAAKPPLPLPISTNTTVSAQPLT